MISNLDINVLSSHIIYFLNPGPWCPHLCEPYCCSQAGQVFSSMSGISPPDSESLASLTSSSPFAGESVGTSDIASTQWQKLAGDQTQPSVKSLRQNLQ